jgi:uncharacterized phiE125 gp8 family phage protein
MPYLIGNAVTISTTITTGTPAVAVDPSTITLTVTKPDSTVDTFAVGSLTHGGTGIYSYVYLPATTGAYRYVWTTTSPASASDGTFYVAASCQAIVTAAEVRAHLNLTDATQDVELQGFISAAQAIVENITGAVVPAVYTETYDGGMTAIILRHTPVLSITSVTENWGPTAYTLTNQPVGSSVDAWGYDLENANSGKVVRRTVTGFPFPFYRGVGNIAITYTAGRASVPADIRLAALRLIEHLWSSQQGRAGRMQQDNPGAAHAVPYFVQELLEPHMTMPGIA